MWIIWDLDQTLADSAHRAHLLPNFDNSNYLDPKNWIAWEAGIMDDAPIQPAVSLLRALPDRIFNHAIVTSRGEPARAATQAWLAANLIPYDFLYMRRIEEYSIPAAEWKTGVAEALRTYANADVVLAFDDHPEICEAYAQLGITAMQVHHQPEGGS